MRSIIVAAGLAFAAPAAQADHVPTVNIPVQDCNAFVEFETMEATVVMNGHGRGDDLATLNDFIAEYYPNIAEITKLMMYDRARGMRDPQWAGEYVEFIDITKEKLKEAYEFGIDNCVASNGQVLPFYPIDRI